MKKLLRCTLTALGLLCVCNLHAQVASLTTSDGSTTTTYTTLQAAIDAAASSDTVTLASNTTEDITIASGKNLTLDLNGCTLTNSSTHTIDNYGKLTIIDSSTGNTGVVDNITNAKSAIYNRPGAEITLSDGTYTRSQEASTGSASTQTGGNSSYTLVNWGTMTIDGEGVVVTQGGTGGKYSSLVENGYYTTDLNTANNNPTLTISAGTFSGGRNTIKNDEFGILYISGGSFTDTQQCAVLNWHKATITGGTFTSTYYAVINSTYGDNAVGDLDISGGTFIGGSSYVAILENTSWPSDDISISGGTFSSAVALEYCATGYIPATTDTSTTTPYTVEGGNYVAALVDTDGTYTGYTSLTELVTAIQTQAYAGTTTFNIVLLDDVEGTENAYFAIANGLTVTLDLNGYALIGKNAGPFIQNSGNLTINDSSDGEGRIYTTNVEAQGRIAVRNNEDGTLVINGGTFGDSDTDRTNANSVQRGNAVRNFGTATINGGYFTACDNYTNGGYAYAIVTDGSSSTNTATLTINDCVVYGSMNGAISADDNSILTVKGGTYSLGDGTETNLFYMVYTCGNGVANIEGGTFTRNTTNTYGTFYADDTSSIAVSGGTFTNAYDSSIKATGTVTLTGGTYSADVQTYCAEGYYSIANADGVTWNVGCPIAQITATDGTVTVYNSATYTLPEVAELLKGGETLTLLADYADTTAVRVKAYEVTIDLNGHNVTNTSTTKTITYCGFNFYPPSTTTVVSGSTTPHSKLINSSSTMATVTGYTAIQTRKGTSVPSSAVMYLDIDYDNITLVGSTSASSPYVTVAANTFVNYNSDYTYADTYFRSYHEEGATTSYVAATNTSAWNKAYDNVAYMMRDIDRSAGTGLTISASGIMDLDGHTITASRSDYPPIKITSDNLTVTVRNGKLVGTGSAYCVSVANTSSNPSENNSLTLENLTMTTE